MKTTNYQLTKHGIETNDPLVGAMFLGKEIEHDVWFTEIVKDEVNKAKPKTWFRTMDCVESTEISDQITIPYPLIAGAIKPVEGKPCFLIHEHAETGFLQCTMFMVYIEEYKPELEEEGYVFVAANPLTTVTPVELRELIARVNA